MNSLLIQYSLLIYRLRREHLLATVTDIKLFFDNVVSYIKDFTYTSETNDSLDILTLISDNLATINTLRLFNHPVLINHPIFIYIGRTLEMLLIKSNYIKSIPMKKYEEDCFYSISYFVTQICLYENEITQSFYGSISDEIIPVTDKINIRDGTINDDSRRSNVITDKPNLKVIGLLPNAPKSRPSEDELCTITKVIHRKHFSNQFIAPTVEKIIESPVPSIPLEDLPLKQYRDIFLTEAFLNKFVRAIDDLSENEYSPYHVKYKVIDRLVRLCSKLNIDNPLFNSIVKCLCSKFYPQIFTTIQSEQFRFSPKQLFFIYRCSQFIIQHKFQEQEQVPHLLCETMINVTKPIIEQILTTNDKENINDIKTAQMTALSHHIKMLNHFAMIRSIRKELLSLPIIDQILSKLEDQSLFDNNGSIANAKHEVIGQSLTLLYNLGVEDEIRSKLKHRNIFSICSKLRLIKDKTIHFMSHFLIIMLDLKTFNDVHEPHLLSKTCVEYIDKCVKEPRLSYEGIKLHRLLKHIEIFVRNDAFTESLAEEKEGILVMTKCVCVINTEEKHLDNQRKEILKRIQQSAVCIIWKLSFYGPTTSKKLKSNDLFIEQLLILLNGTSQKSKQNADAIIWRLGSEAAIRYEQTEKEKHKQRFKKDTTDEDQLNLTDEWDETIPYDVLISYSNIINDVILANKIYNRLSSKGYRVYSEKQGKHRLELIEKAVSKKKPILACLSSTYRASKICMAEIEYANTHSSPIIPVLVEAKYKMQGWLKHVIGGKNPIDLTQKNFNEELLKVFDEIEKTKSLD
ncbi:unnamed protein product [Rotaria sp. Silwood1]|nr:unnamed protein product [Rotaria sp. Silwood1]